MQGLDKQKLQIASEAQGSECSQRLGHLVDLVP